MRLLPAALVAVGLAVSAAALDIELFITNSTCGADDGGHFVCSDIAELTCCHAGSPGLTFQSARCDGLGVTDVCTFGGEPRRKKHPHPPVGRCGHVCNAYAGPTPQCLDPGICWEGFGAYWIHVPPGTYAEQVPSVCEKTVEPDRVVFANGQSFRINHGVPAKITAQLTELVKSDPVLANGVPEEVAPFALTAEKSA